MPRQGIGNAQAKPGQAKAMAMPRPKPGNVKAHAFLKSVEIRCVSECFLDAPQGNGHAMPRPCPGKVKARPGQSPGQGHWMERDGVSPYPLPYQKEREAAFPILWMERDGVSPSPSLYLPPHPFYIPPFPSPDPSSPLLRSIPLRPL